MQRVQYNRKTSPKVRGGKVQKKNNHRLTLKRGFVVDRVSPRKGFKHLVTKQELFDFIELIPNWQQVLYGIECILLSEGSDEVDGLYLPYRREKTGIIRISAWRKELVQEIRKDYFDAHISIFEKIDLKFERRKDCVNCWFDEPKAKAFVLMHVFLHELGHHHDFMQRRAISSGETFAQDFAKRLENTIWPKYIEKFGKP